MNLPSTGPIATGASLPGIRFCDRPMLLVSALLAVTVAFSLPLLDLVKLASRSDLYSHVVLIPLVSLYLIWQQRGKPLSPSAPLRAGSIVTLGLAAIVMGWYWMSSASAANMAAEDRLAIQISAFVLVIYAVCAFFLGRRTLWAIAFPLGFLACMVPLPTFVVNGIEVFYQHTSAAAAALFFKLAGTPFYRVQTFFQLPGINLEVAPECSGIRSSLALFITSLVAGHLFLRSRANRALLAFVVIPLGIVRNGLRIFVIGQLCVHISPDMIDSYIHRQGGPVFFALSLIPFSLFLYFLVRSERSKLPKPSVQVLPASAPAAPASPL